MAKCYERKSFYYKGYIHYNSVPKYLGDSFWISFLILYSYIYYKFFCFHCCIVLEGSQENLLSQNIGAIRKTARDCHTKISPSSNIHLFAPWLTGKYMLLSATKKKKKALEDRTVTKDINKRFNIRCGRQTGKSPYCTQVLENILFACLIKTHSRESVQNDWGQLLP